jgi:hypothetical protein
MRELMDVGCNALHRISSSSGDGCSIGLVSLLMAQYIAPYGLRVAPYGLMDELGGDEHV